MTWQLRVDHHFHVPPRGEEPCESLAQIRAAIADLKGVLMTTLAEHAAALAALSTNVAKIGDETRMLLGNIADLQAAIVAGGVTTPEIDNAMTALLAQVAVVDSLVPDAPQVPDTP